MPYEELECLDGYRGSCSGTVEYRHTSSFGKGFPRCEKHHAERMARRQNSIEQYADSDVPPAWFDPTAAGERWNEDD